MTSPNIINIEVNGRPSGLCRTGVPFPEGQLQSLEELAFYCEDRPIDNFSRALSLWPDGSIKWLHLGFFPTQDQAQTGTYQLSLKTDQALRTNQIPTQPSGLEVKETASRIQIETTQCHYQIDLENLSLLYKKEGVLKPLIADLAGDLSLKGHEQCEAVYKTKTIRKALDLNSSACSAVEIEIAGAFNYVSNKQPLHFKSIITFFDQRPLIKYQHTLHNPNAAQHSGGLWELGDSGSEEVTSLQLQVCWGEGKKTYRTSPADEPVLATSNTRLIQYASGGQQWQSPNHVDKSNRVPLHRNGFSTFVEKKPIKHGQRATPIFSSGCVSLTVENFWQNFPKAVAMTGDTILVDLFPQIDNNNQELQGGEQKTHTLWLSHDNGKRSLEWVHNPPTARPDPQYLIKNPVGSIYLFTASKPDNKINKLIRNGLEDKQNFFNKREIIDEYGWRHFGELYADHETAGYMGDELFASHYNNQYDPLYGFLRQFLLSGDSRWFELADDLAKHIKDIDIYHTKDDKAEYNGGLFWHTDHYLKAYNSTHRSYSSLQAKDAYEDRAGGGGPGGQHCYTTGLTLHYFLTGQESSRQAVLTLTEWITHFYEGTGTCLELLQAINTRHTPGLKNPLSGHYPLDRGTANYMIALLDSYEITKNEEYLQRVESIIQKTVHPADNIESRDLGNVELCWFYIIFLQALCRYLMVKEVAGSLDNDFFYARDTLLHYADWMLACEQPYLDKPEILEFPNDTWTAQDLRKACVFAAAAHYTTTSSHQYQEKAQFFEHHVAQTLTESDEKTYTRVLALLMQNHGISNFYENKQKNPGLRPRRYNWPKGHARQEKLFGKALTKELFGRLLRLSPSAEIDWLKKRLRG